MDSLSFILAAFAPIAGRHLLDVGCGGGFLAKALSDRRAVVTGIDPSWTEIEAAAAREKRAKFLVGSALQIPCPRGAFGGVVFLNALHHIAPPRAALREAARVVSPGGFVVIVEPLAEGSFFEALRLIEDETEIRAQAQAEIADAIAAGEFRCEREATFVRNDVFGGIAPFLARALAADRSRADAIETHRAAITKRFIASAQEKSGGYVLRQPLRGHVLSPTP